MPAKRAVIYARVSTNGQTTDNQVEALRSVAARRGWEVVAEYVDAGVSGTKDRRPELDRMMKAGVRGEFDLIMAWSVDRLGRSLKHLVTLLDELRAVGVDLYLDQQTIDRTKAGLARARAKGKRLGRPPIKPRVVKRIRELRATGLSMGKIAVEVGCSVGIVHRIVSEDATAEERRLTA